MTKSVLIIAEAGVNHNGDLDTALRMVDAAAKAGADAVKFQTFTASRLAAPDAGRAEYQKAAGAGSQLDMLKALELSREAHHTLLDHARACGVGFLSSPFDEPSVDFLLELGVSPLKIPSGEIVNVPLLRRIGRSKVPVILSTGMCTMDDIALGVDTLTEAGTDIRDISLLHCNTAYPTPARDVNLRAMQTLAKHFPQCDIGFSDHTVGTECAIGAVALGARIIEKHFTLDRNMDGPDHRASLIPEELQAMVKAIRTVERALGSGTKQPTPSESQNADAARKHIVAACPIARGTIFTPENLAVLRTGRPGLSPRHWDEVVGGTATRDYAAYEDIEP